MKSEDNLSIHISNPLNFAILVHRPDGTISKCRGRTKQLLGYSQQQLVGKKIEELDLLFIQKNGKSISPESYPIQQVIDHNREIKDELFGVFINTERSINWVKVTGYPNKDIDGNILEVITTYQETELHPSMITSPPLSSNANDIWEKTFDALQDVVTILAPDLKVIRANKATYRIFDITEDELIGKPCYEVFQGRDEPCVNCPVWQPEPSSSATESKIIYNQRLDRSFDVSSSPAFAEDGTLQFLIHSARDVTQKIKNEDQRNILSAAVEQITESVVITDEFGAIQYVNPSYTQTTGYTLQEVIGKDLSFLNINPDSESIFQEINSTLQAGATWEGRLTNRKKDSAIFEEYATISPLSKGEGQISNFVAVKRDVTQEEQLRIQLQQSSKMEAIGTLAGGIAHDFNNILSAMIGYGQIAKGRLQQDDPLLTDIEQILQAGDRAANLVKQILAFSRRDTQENFLPIQLQYIIKEVMNLLRSSFPATIEICREINSNCDPILADPGQLHQVLINLCTNAKQAIGEQYGRLTIRLEEIMVNEPQILSGTSLLTSGRYAHLTVEDNGTGMNDATKERIFDPFFTTKALGKGTGLGLSVVHGIVEKHGGTITVESQENIGSIFHLYFPIVKQKVEGDTASTESDTPGTERVMLVDDEVMLAKLMSRMLTKLGYKVTIFTDSLKAVREYRKNPYEFDAVITDMTMPNMTGAELAREALSLRPELPIIMTTGYNESINEEKAKRIGITKFLLKPLKKKTLAKELRMVLNNA